MIEAHEAALTAFQTERDKLRAAKSTFFTVLSLAKGLRNTEMAMAVRPIERVATLNRFRTLVADLEADVKTALDRKMVDQLRDQAEADLKVAKRDTVQIEQIDRQQRSLILRQQRNLWRNDLDGSPLVHPILSPKLVENRR